MVRNSQTRVLRAPDRIPSLSSDSKDPKAVAEQLVPIRAHLNRSGYYNPFLAFGLENLMKESTDAGVSGFIVVDLPPEEGAEFVKLCSKYA